MISYARQTVSDAAAASTQVLVRYGVIPQVARFGLPDAADGQNSEAETKCFDVKGPATCDDWSDPAARRIQRGTKVVVETDRGHEVGEILEQLTESPEKNASVGQILRVATATDIASQQQRELAAAAAFSEWEQRISQWNLELQLVDLEWTLDGERLVLYVLNERGAETTRLALLAAAGGLGIVSVQPVTAEGVADGSGGGCGSSCGCAH